MSISVTNCHGLKHVSGKGGTTSSANWQSDTDSLYMISSSVFIYSRCFRTSARSDITSHHKLPCEYHDYLVQVSRRRQTLPLQTLLF